MADHTPKLPPMPEPLAHICVLPTKDAGPTKFFTAPSDTRGFPVHPADQVRAYGIDCYERCLADAREAAQSIEQAPRAEWAAMICYPQHWDTAAYPTLESAIGEALAAQGCSACKDPTAYGIEQARELSDEEIDRHVDAVLRASGSALRNYTLPKSIDDLRAAMRRVLAAAGGNQTEREGKDV